MPLTRRTRRTLLRSIFLVPTFAIVPVAAGCDGSSGRRSPAPEGPLSWLDQPLREVRRELTARGSDWHCIDGLHIRSAQFTSRERVTGCRGHVGDTTLYFYNTVMSDSTLVVAYQLPATAAAVGRVADSISQQLTERYGRPRSCLDDTVQFDDAVAHAIWTHDGRGIKLVALKLRPGAEEAIVNLQVHSGVPDCRQWVAPPAVR